MGEDKTTGRHLSLPTTRVLPDVMCVAIKNKTKILDVCPVVTRCIYADEQKRDLSVRWRKPRQQMHETLDTDATDYRFRRACVSCIHCRTPRTHTWS